MAKNVTIQRIVGVLLHRIKFIILATVVMGLLFFMYSRFVIAPMYSTSTMIYVQNYSSSQRANANADTKSTTPKKADDDTAKKTTEIATQTTRQQQNQQQLLQRQEMQQLHFQ